MRIIFVDQTKGHNPKTLYDKPTGGTLTSLTKVPEYLAANGHDVWVSSSYNCQEGEIINGVHYLHGDQTKMPKWDVIVFNRNVLPKDFVLYNKQSNIKIIWWLHDIVDTRYLPDDAFQFVDHIVALSQYCKDTYKDFYNIPEEKFTIISNGIDPEIFFPGRYEDKNPRLFITASALIKGYLPIETTFTNLKWHDPEIDFRIYSNQKLHGLENTPAQIKFLDHMTEAGAHVYAPMSPKSLAVVMRKAWALLMPNTYPEICSNLLLQARACGLPIVSSQIGANPEFLNNTQGLLTSKWYPHDVHSWIVEYANLVCTLQIDKDLHKKLSEEAPKGVPTWREVGNAWHELLKTVTSELQIL